MDLNNGIGFGAISGQQASVDRPGVDHYDLALALDSRTWGMPHHNLSVKPVVVLPKGFSDVQIGATGVVKSSVGGDPTVALEHLRKLPQTLQPLTRETIPELAVGIHC